MNPLAPARVDYYCLLSAWNMARRSQPDSIARVGYMDSIRIFARYSPDPEIVAKARSFLAALGAEGV